jgi:hypothetical protein
MIAAAALCPAPPLLVRELTGAQVVAADLRNACLDSVAELVAAVPDVIAVVGAAERTRRWSESAAFDLASYAPGPVLTNGQAGARQTAGSLPSAVGVGAWLVGQASSAGFTPAQVLQSVGADEPASLCARLGAELAGLGERVALLVMADGSARRGLKAPGYLDERSAWFDAFVQDAVAAGRLDALLDIDEALARDLMATGRPAWQVLAGALAGHKVSSEIRYRDDPYGVAYLVASLRLRNRP